MKQDEVDEVKNDWTSMGADINTSATHMSILYVQNNFSYKGGQNKIWQNMWEVKNKMCKVIAK